jgi:hypothetical protein
VYKLTSTLEERLRFAAENISRELFEEIYALGDAGKKIFEARHAQAQALNEDLYVQATTNLCVGLSDGLILGACGLLRNLPDGKKYPDHILSPRRETAYYALNRTGPRWMLEGMALGRIDPLLADAGEPTEPAVDAFAGVGRNDPCPCGSGKKFKKCHEPQLTAPSARPLPALLKAATYARQFYRLDFKQQLERYGDARVREHLEILASAELRADARKDAYFQLAVIARAAHKLDAAPRWAVNQALAFAEGEGHEAGDRARIAAFAIMKSAKDDRDVAERAVAAIERAQDLTPGGLAALAGALLDSHEDIPDLILKVANHPAGKGEIRLALARAMAYHEKKDEEKARPELDAVLAAIKDDATNRNVFVIVEEARAALEDPLDEFVLPEERRGKIIEPPPQPTPETRPTRAASYIDHSLAETAKTAVAASEAGTQRLSADADAARAEADASWKVVLDLERRLEEARIQANRARRLLAQREAARDESRSRELAPAVGLALAALELTGKAMSTRLAAAHLRGEVPVHVVAALTGRRAAILLPVAPTVLRGEGDPVHIDMALGTFAAIGEVENERVRSIVPADVQGRLAVVVDLPEFRDADEANERFELWADALDGAWGKLARVVGPGFVPQVLTLSGPAASEVVRTSRELDRIPLPRIELELKEGEPVPLTTAITWFHHAPSDVARALGARGLFSGDKIPMTAIEALREYFGTESSARVEVAPVGFYSDGRDPLEDDTNPTRRLLRATLRRLLRFGKIGGSHTRFDNAVSGAPPHLRGTLRSAMQELITLGVLRPKSTLTGLHISIEPKRVAEVERAVEAGEIVWSRVRDAIEVG